MTDKKENCEELLKELRVYRNDMVARNYPFQQISDIITKWEMKKIKTASDELEPVEDFLDQTFKVQVILTPLTIMGVHYLGLSI